MKRPHGFDPAQRGVTKPQAPQAQKASVQKSSAQKSSTQKAQAPKAPRAEKAPRVRVTKPQSAPPTPDLASARRADRAAKLELRRAARERRRYERTEVRRFTRRARNRRIGLITTAGVVVVLGAMLAIAVFSPILALRTVRVEGTSRVDQALVTAAIDDQLGTPLALLDFSRLTQELGEVPLIRSYSTETVPPDTLVITITEREPVVAAEAAVGWELVDPAGIVVQTVAERPTDMPIISAGEKSGPTFTAAVTVLLALPNKMRQRVYSVSATTVDDVAFQFGDTNQNVIWGSSERSDLKLTALKGLIKANEDDTSVDFNVSSPEIALVIDK